MRQWQPYLITFLLTLTGVAAVAGSAAAMRYRGELGRVEGERGRAQEELEESREKVKSLEDANGTLEDDLKDAQDGKRAEEAKRKTAVAERDQAKQALTKEQGRALSQDDPRVIKIIGDRTKELQEELLTRDHLLVGKDKEIETLTNEVRAAHQVSQRLSGLRDSQPWRVTKYWRAPKGQTNKNLPVYLVWTSNAQLVLVVDDGEGTPNAKAGLRARGQPMDSGSREDPLADLRRDLLNLQASAPSPESADSGSDAEESSKPRRVERRTLKVHGTTYELRTLETPPTDPNQYLHELLELLSGVEFKSEPKPEDLESTPATGGSPS